MENEILIIEGQGKNKSLVARYEGENVFSLWEIEPDGREINAGSIIKSWGNRYNLLADKKYTEPVSKKWGDLVKLVDMIEDYR